MNKKDLALEELKEIEKSKGILNPADVVERAKDPKSALHSKFNWNIKEAAYEYWLWQARQLITVYVQVRQDKPTETMQVFVSLSTDRNSYGGYRKMDNVLSDEHYRQILLNDAMNEMLIFEKKYKQLTELVTVFDVMNHVTQKIKNKAKV